MILWMMTVCGECAMNRYTQLSHAPTPAVHGLSPRHFPPHQRERGTINTKYVWKLK
jgi:hypothetical protein